jgi:hypothetical protein
MVWVVMPPNYELAQSAAATRRFATPDAPAAQKRSTTLRRGGQPNAAAAGVKKHGRGIQTHTWW